MYPLAVLIVGVLLIWIGVYQRRRLGRPADRAFGTKLALVSLGGASAIVLGAFPALYVLIHHATHGGPIERSLPPGVSTEAVLGLLVVGMVMGLTHAFYSFVEHLTSESVRPPTSDPRQESDSA